VISRVTLTPSGGGRFEVTLDGDLLFSKAALKRHADAGEVHGLVAARLGPPIDRGDAH
jgi:predicted Rdx family selenoprotein